MQRLIALTLFTLSVPAMAACAGGRPGPITKLLPASGAAAATQNHAADHAAQRAAAHAANPSRSHAAPAQHHASDRNHARSHASGRVHAGAMEHPSHQAGAADVAAIEKWLDGYDAAFIAKDLEKLASYYHPDVTIYEGGGIDNGWVDYRDTHLGPELKSFENLQFGHTDRKIHVLGDGRSAYVTSNYFIKAKMGERTLDSGGLETLVLIKGADGAWRIRHTHTSARARRPAGGGV